MSVSKADLEELKRLATNTYDEDKKFMNRIISGIGAMDQEIRQLKAKLEKVEG
jgi:hypothetical protein